MFEDGETPNSNKGKGSLKARVKARTDKKRRQRGGSVDIQKWISKVGIEFHWPGYQHIGPGTKLAKRLRRGYPEINRPDKLARQHVIDYSKAKSHSKN